jgi:hypothetical protein
MEWEVRFLDHPTRKRHNQVMLIGADLEKAKLDSAYGIYNEIFSDKRERGTL